MEYTEAFKEQMIRRMVGPNKISANALAKETGVSQSQLSRWLRAAHTVGTGSDRPDPKPTAGSEKWRPGEKLRLLLEAERLQGEELGAFLRREGLHEAQLQTWRDAAAGALSAEAAPISAQLRRDLSEAKRRVKALDRELRRKEKALAEAAALLMLEKKLKALGWDSDDEDGSTGERSGK